MGRSRCRRQFSRALAKGMVAGPEDGSGPARALVEAFGGTTLCHSFA